MFLVFVYSRNAMSSPVVPDGRTYIVCILKSQARFSGRIVTLPLESLVNMPLSGCFRSQIQRIWLFLPLPESRRQIKAKYVPGLSSDLSPEPRKRRKGVKPLPR